jgi:formylglycine-generating enzyme required for sulfatase activity
MEALPLKLLAAYPVTVAQFRPFVEQGGYHNANWWTPDSWKRREEKKRMQPDEWENPDFALGNHPVVGVSWYEAVAWCRWLTARLPEQGRLPEDMLIRLPTEAEWEWAARGPERLRWPWGDDWPKDGVPCNSEEAGLGGTSAVGLFPAGRAQVIDPETGLTLPGERAEALYDQAGNVWEWCATRWLNEYLLPVTDEWSDDYLVGGDIRVLRGGAWGNNSARVRGAARDGSYPGFRYDDWGFRCCAATASRGL